MDTGEEKLKNGELCFGVPPEVSKGLGINSDWIRRLTITFSNKDFCRMHVDLMPEADKKLRAFLREHDFVAVKKKSYEPKDSEATAPGALDKAGAAVVHSPDSPEQA